MKIYKLVILIAIIFAAIPVASSAQSTDVTFFTDSQQDEFGRGNVEAELRDISSRAYIYVDKNYSDGLSVEENFALNRQLVSLGDEFSNVIYPRLRSLYGTEWNPGIDNDSRITIFVTDLKSGINAYINSGDRLSTSVNTRSNQREMVYVSSDVIQTDFAKHHLAHEFTHLIELNQKDRLNSVTDQTWLSEALAEYAPTYLGYNDIYSGSYLQDRVGDFLANPSTPLTMFNSTPADFGASGLFAHYLAGHYGTGFMQDLMQGPEVGRQNVTAALAAHGENDTFADVYTRWQVANFVNSPALNSAGEKDARYSYTNPNLSASNLRVTATNESSLFSSSEVSFSFALPGGASHWVRFVPGNFESSTRGDLELTFESSQDFGNLNLPYIITDITGETQVHYDEGDGNILVEDFGSSVLSVTVVPSNSLQNDLVGNPPNTTYNLQASVSSEEGGGENTNNSAQTGQVVEGSLIRAEGDAKVYVVKGSTKRWIPSAEVFNGYGHLRWQDIIEVSPSVLAQYQESRLVKFEGDYRVYQVNTAGNIKQWLNITPVQFNSSGRLWNAIYEINQNEFNWYSTEQELVQ